MDSGICLLCDIENDMVGEDKGGYRRENIESELDFTRIAENSKGHGCPLTLLNYYFDHRNTWHFKNGIIKNYNISMILYYIYDL